MLPAGVVGDAANALLTIAFVLVVVAQCRKPRWLPGRLILMGMNRSHLALTRWGLAGVDVATNATILDVGCGGGRTIQTLASLAPTGIVHGVDYAAASVAAARRTNARSIEEGRVDIQLASVSALPFPQDAFDLVTAVETHYYWPSLIDDLREVLRVLKPGGTLVIVAEAYRGRSMDWLYRPAMRMLRARYLTIEEHRQFLTDAGYEAVDVSVEPAKGWLRATGRKSR